MKNQILFLIFIISLTNCKETLIFSDEFDTLDLKTWRHDITLGGGGNWEFEMYYNNRTNSFAKDSILHI